MTAYLAKLLKEKMKAHTTHHFRQSTIPNDPYSLHSSHNPDGSANSLSCTAIRGELGYKSRILDTFSATLSAGIASHFVRGLTKKSQLEKKFNEALKTALKHDQHRTDHNNLMNILLLELASKTTGAEERVLHVFRQHPELINVTDSNGQTLLHNLIAEKKYGLAKQLLEIEGININIQDKSGNSPLLMLMQQMNSALFTNTSAYQFGIKLLENPTLNLSLINIEGESAGNIYASWYTSGTLPLARAFSTKLEERLRKPTDVASLTDSVRSVLKPPRA
jgi:hypothetical protein